jgi:hypothetical protein
MCASQRRASAAQPEKECRGQITHQCLTKSVWVHTDIDWYDPTQIFGHFEIVLIGKRSNDCGKIVGLAAG